MYCEQCGQRIADDAVFCEYCGESQTPVSETVTPPPVIVPPTPPVKSKGFLVPFIIAAAVVTVLVAVLVGVLVWRNSDRRDMPAGSLADSFGSVSREGIVPSLEGMPVDEAIEAVEAVGLSAQIEYLHDDTVEVDRVLSQSIEADTVLPGGSTIVLVVSSGPDLSCPYDYTQKVTVEASAGSSSATLTLYEWENGDWAQKFRCAATVGKNGIGAAYGEGTKMTPLGTFKLGVILTDDAIANADWPVYYVSADTCVVDDVTSAYYNTIRSISALPAGVHYDAIGQTIVNGNSDLCIYIEHNGDGYSSDGVVAGKGSLITICAKTSTLYATAGCIDIAHTDMASLLSLLDYAQNPHIETKVIS